MRKKELRKVVGRWIDGKEVDKYKYQVQVVQDSGKKGFKLNNRKEWGVNLNIIIICTSNMAFLELLSLFWFFKKKTMTLYKPFLS